jgi:hypothetical protein
VREQQKTPVARYYEGFSVADPRDFDAPPEGREKSAKTPKNAAAKPLAGRVHKRDGVD